ncbi:large ribosomal subunit protein mL64 [Tiliqua scincoides]|uniref:large ribosomal subunit protein mL64 n=1 Tax=Tiliqua scincoides TaxID=71010 RepID=UPI003461C688
MAGAGRWLLLGGVRSYNVRPLRRQLGGVYLPDPANPRTPAWQLEAAYEAKLFGRYGAASGVDPARLWPAPERLREMEAAERASCPSLREMEAALDAKESEVAAQQRRREELIAARMAKMPQMIADWRREKAERKAKEREEKDRRQRLLAEARERFGHNLDHRSPQFQELMQEMEKKRRKELKLQKKQQREQVVAQRVAGETAAATSPSEKEGEVVVAVALPQVL